MLKKYFDRQILSYLIFGVLTTLVNIVSYKVLSLFINYLAANVLAWIISVVFAYITNRKYVFKSTATGSRLLGEAAAFLGARVFSGVIDMAIMYCGVTLLAKDDNIVKLAANVIVIVLNYILGKWVVFVKKQR